MAHRFWNTRPVPLEEGGSEIGPIENISYQDVPKEPHPLAQSLEWWNPDLNDDAELTEIYELLRDHYVEDTFGSFRFHYSKEFLRWALLPPGYVKEWHVAVRRKGDKRVIGFVAGTPAHLRMGTPTNSLNTENNSQNDMPSDVKNQNGPNNGGFPMIASSTEHSTNDSDMTLQPASSTTRLIAEINFLCIDKVLREKRMAPLLISEVTRRINLHHIFQAVYTAGKLITTPFTVARYYHRSLNPQKLLEVKFSSLPPSFANSPNGLKLYMLSLELPKPVPAIQKHLRLMKKKDVKYVTDLLNTELQKYRIAPTFTKKEVLHYFLPRPDIIYTYVKTDSKTDQPTDFFSFYHVTTSVLGDIKYDSIEICYVYYYAINTVPAKQMWIEMLRIAKELKFDVLNIVTIQDNEHFLDELRFMAGNGVLHYYFYNWAHPQIPSNEVGLIMV